jgi:hypothetical protein
MAILGEQGWYPDHGQGVDGTVGGFGTNTVGFPSHSGVAPRQQPYSYGFGVMPMYVQPIPRIAPRELPPFVSAKNKSFRDKETAGADHQDQTQSADHTESGKRQDQDESKDTACSDSSGASKSCEATVCQFYVKNGSCAYGNRCKFQHPIELAPRVQYNSVGLPMRPGEKVCTYYMRHGRCSYGHTCKYDHPEIFQIPMHVQGYFPM